MTVTYSGDAQLEVQDKLYDVEFFATAEYTYSPGCMYKRNGDPGDPPEEDFYLMDVDAIWRLDGEEVEETPEMADTLTNYLYDNQEEFLQDAPDDYDDYDYEEV